MIGIGPQGPLGPPTGAAPPARGEGGAAAGSFVAGSPPAVEGPVLGERVAMPAAREREGLAVLACVEGIGPVTLARLINHVGSASAILDLARTGPLATADLVDASRDPVGDGRAMGDGVARAVIRAAASEAAILADIDRAGLTLVALGDTTYPARLRSIDLPPHVLFVRGDPRALNAVRAVAVVGTRRPTPAGRHAASRIAAALVRAGACVVSGLAIGIDGAAHAAAVAEGGLTVAVIGGGHGQLFPRAHRTLADAIVDGGGAVVSEHGPRSVPTRGTFPRRNRIISGLAEAVVVVEAGARSGALTTAAWALEQGRGCHLVPGPIDAPMSAGCLAFLRECRGEAQIVAGIPQLLEDLRLAVAIDPARGSALPTTPSRRARPRPPSAEALLLDVGPAARRVAEAILAGYPTADEIVAVTGLPIAAVLGTLTVLEMRGLVAGAYGRYSPAGPLARLPTDGQNPAA
jgi:DNA processing protein